MLLFDAIILSTVIGAEAGDWSHELLMVASTVVGAGGLRAIIWGKEKARERKNGNGDNTKERLAAGAEKFEALEYRLTAVERGQDKLEHEIQLLRAYIHEIDKNLVQRLTRIETLMEMQMRQEKG